MAAQLTYGIITVTLNGRLNAEIEAMGETTGKLATLATKRNIKIDSYILMTNPTKKELLKRIKLAVEKQQEDRPISYLILYSLRAIIPNKAEAFAFMDYLLKTYGIETLTVKQ